MEMGEGAGDVVGVRRGKRRLEVHVLLDGEAEAELAGETGLDGIDDDDIEGSGRAGDEGG